jgi:hypothetical protein
MDPGTVDSWRQSSRSINPNANTTYPISDELRPLDRYHFAAVESTY